MLERDLLGPPFVVVMNPHERNPGGLRRHPGVLASKMADPDHRQANRPGRDHRVRRLT
jgi:hypothetical protein